MPAEIDMTNAFDVSDQLLAVLDQGATLLVVDMTRTSYCASAGVHALLHARRSVIASSAVLRLAASQWAVRRILELTGADQLVDTYPSLEAAVAGTAFERER